MFFSNINLHNSEYFNILKRQKIVKEVETEPVPKGKDNDAEKTPSASSENKKEKTIIKVPIDNILKELDILSEFHKPIIQTQKDSFTQKSLEELFNKSEGLGGIGLFERLQELSDSEDEGIKEFVRIINETFENYSIADRDDLKIYMLKQILSLVNKQNGNVNGNIGVYGISPEDISSFVKCGDFLKVLQDIVKSDELKNNFENGFNGQVDDFAQTSSGPCGLLSSIKALNSSKMGREILSQSIQWSDDKSSVTIVFAGVNKSYTIPLMEILENHDNYVTGDIEAAALMMAIEKLRREIAVGKANIEPYNEYNGDGNLPDDDGNPGSGIYAASSNQLIYCLTGKHAAPLDGDDVKNREILESFREHLLTDGFVSYASTISLSDENLYNFYKRHNVNKLSEEDLNALRGTGHGLAIIGANKNGVIIAPPESTQTIEISWEEFYTMGIDSIEEVALWE